MQIIQRYMMTIHDVFTITDVGICGAETEISVLDGAAEVERVKFSGKCQSEGGYSRSYHGTHGLTAVVVKGPGRAVLEPLAA